MRKYLIVKVQEIPDHVIEAAAMLDQPHLAIFWMNDLALNFLKRVNDAGIILNYLPGGRPAGVHWTNWNPGSEMPATLRGMWFRVDEERYSIEDLPDWKVHYAHAIENLPISPYTEQLETMGPGVTLDFSNGINFYADIEKWNVEVETQTIPLDELLMELSQQPAIEVKVAK